jgi:WD40 repeat protein
MTGAGKAPLLLVATALLAGAAPPGCARSPLRGRSIAEPLDGPDAIVAIGRSGDVAYAITRSRQLRAWDLKTRALRTLRRDGVIGIARDGAVALSASDTVVDVWEPASGRVIATHRFAYGIVTARGVSPATAYIVARRQPIHWPPNAAAAPPPDTDLASWDLASGKITSQSVRDCEDLWMSGDGARTLCDLTWSDRPAGAVGHPPLLAPEWAPAPSDPEPPPDGCAKCAPHVPDTGHSVLSSWLSADGRTVYVTYMRTVGHNEWRLDRWSPDTTGKTEGRVEHLAVSHEPIVDRVVAVSPDGRSVLTDPGLRPAVLRHAPGYEGIPLLAPPVTAAAFSDNGRLVVTGHGDGQLRLWEADSGRFVASSPD